MRRSNSISDWVALGWLFGPSRIIHLDQNLAITPLKKDIFAKVFVSAKRFNPNLIFPFSHFFIHWGKIKYIAWNEKRKKQIWIFFFRILWNVANSEVFCQSKKSSKNIFFLRSGNKYFLHWLGKLIGSVFLSTLKRVKKCTNQLKK